MVRFVAELGDALGGYVGTLRHMFKLYCPMGTLTLTLTLTLALILTVTLTRTRTRTGPGKLEMNNPAFMKWVRNVGLLRYISVYLRTSPHIISPYISVSLRNVGLLWLCRPSIYPNPNPGPDCNCTPNPSLNPSPNPNPKPNPNYQGSGGPPRADRGRRPAPGVASRGRSSHLSCWY